MCCCTVRCCCCVVVRCCTVVLLLWAPSSSYNTELHHWVDTLSCNPTVTTPSCYCGLLHCCAALLCFTVALLCCAALLRSVRRPLRVTTPSCYTSGLVPSVVTEGIPLRDRWFEPQVQNRPLTHNQNPISGARKGHSRFLERLWYPTPFDFFKPPDKLVSGFDSMGPDLCDRLQGRSYGVV